MNDDKKSMFVIIGMFFLLLIIIIPPVFRVMFPRVVEDNSSNEKKEREELLVCQKTFTNSNYYTVSRVKYINDIPVENKITYSLLNDNNIVLGDVNNMSAIKPEDESSFFRGLNNVDIISNGTDVSVSINQSLIDSNPNNLELINYLQDITNQKEFYTNAGYSCGFSDD